ncbi:hypothetical protein AB0O54_15240 [Pseudarthrobacter oxydans]
MSATEPTSRAFGAERFGGLRAAGDVGELQIDAVEVLDEAGKFQRHADAGIAHRDGGPGRHGRGQRCQ